MLYASRFCLLFVLSLTVACGADSDAQPADVAPDASGATDTDARDPDAGASDAGVDVAPEDVRDDLTMDSGDGSHPDTGASDADAGGEDADAASDTDSDADDASLEPHDAEVDAGTDADSDADSDADGGVSEDWPLAGFGLLTGDCNELDDELLSTSPSVFSNTIDFGDDPFDDDVDDPELTPDGRAMLAAGNAGGSSIYSELFALESLVRCEDAMLLETETTIVYDREGSITDFLVLIDDLRIGVSVVRAFRFPPEGEYTVEQAAHVLRGKLTDILESSANVNEAFAWEKQILHVVAYSDRYADSIRAALPTLPPEVLADTIVMITTTSGDDAFVY